MSEFNADWWTANGSLAQPKKEIADYVESEGFLVPRRLSDLDEVMWHTNRGYTVMVRSEHPEEYAGPSGLFETHTTYPTKERRADPANSIIMDPFISETAKLKRLKDLARESFRVTHYADLTNQSLDEFVDKLSFSYWEAIRGTNLAVVADDAVAGRYHVLVSSIGGFSRYYYEGMVVNEGGETLMTSGESKLGPEAVKKIIGQYEAIRNLPRFNADNCPLMEMQLDNQDRLWFLQYHQVRKFNAPSGPLDPSDFDAAEGWQQAEFARGQIEPSTLKTSLWYPDYPDLYGLPGSIVETLPESDEAAISAQIVAPLSEILSRRRKAFVHRNGFGRLYDDMAAHHFDRSKWFKPQASLALNRDQGDALIPDEIAEKTMTSMIRDGRMARLVLDFASDGKIGFVRLNPDSPQPIDTDF
ncbi:MAG TPA: hypothetical protein VMT23_03755 [Candidatus Binatia bacterium]|nr:hypothetical protein [Candidatus Binatia bacterium]